MSLKILTSSVTPRDAQILHFSLFFLFLFSLYFQKRDSQSSLDEQGYLKKYFDSKKLFSENQL